MDPSNFINTTQLAYSFLGIPLLILAIGLLALKGIALWKAARLKEQGWFWAMLVLATFGILPAIYLFNILRIFVLLIVGSTSKRAFDFMHLYFWQATLILMIATVWVGWLMLVVYREKKPVAVSS